MSAIFATNTGTEAMFLFIAENLGYRSGTETGKIAFGKQAYVEGKLHDLNYEATITDNMTSEQIKQEQLRAESDRASAFENIWLQRMYTDLDKVYGVELTANIYKNKVLAGRPFDTVFKAPLPNKQWEVPIELDAGASMVQYMAVLTGDERLMRMTNMIGDDELNDPWSCNGIPRTMFKHAATPRLYGSSQECFLIWQDKKHKYDITQVTAFNNELATGPLGVANAFKDFIIDNVQPSPTMTVRIWGQDFQIECNRFKQEGVETRNYTFFDTELGLLQPVQHTKTASKPDLEQFRRYFVTLLIHHLDSRVADIISGKYAEKYGTGIDIYDAFIINPEAAQDVRNWYSELMEQIYTERLTILSEYFQSIGITGAATSDWQNLQDRIHPFKGEFKCRRMALK